MKVKHLKTKTTIELTPGELHDWISRVNTLENITDFSLKINSNNRIVKNVEDFIDLIDVDTNKQAF